MNKELSQQLIDALETCDEGGYVDIDGDWRPIQSFNKDKIASALKAVRDGRVMPVGGFGLSPELIEKLRTNGLKPEEISGKPDVQHKRVSELLRWFARRVDGDSNPKWTQAHAFELAYYLATEGLDRGLDIIELEESAWKKGVNISSTDQSMLQRIDPIKFPPTLPMEAEDWAELYHLREDVKALASTGFSTWQDLAVSLKRQLSTQPLDTAEIVALREDAGRWRKLVKASEMTFPILTIADDPENDCILSYGRKALENLVDECDEISDTLKIY